MKKIFDPLEGIFNANLFLVLNLINCVAVLRVNKESL